MHVPSSDLGPIPDDWTVCPLGGLLSELRNGSTAHQNAEGRGLPVTRIETISSGRIDYARVGHVDLPAAALERLEPGDVLLSHINSVAHIGKVARYGGDLPLYHGMNLLLLRFNPDQIDPAFAFLCLASPSAKAFFEARCKKAINQASLNRGDVSALRLPVPPISEQRKIVAVLSAVDETIAANQAVIGQLQVVKNAMLADLLARGIPGRHGRFRVTEIGELPEEWEVARLGAVTLDSAFGPRFPGSSYDAQGNFGTLRTTDITDDWEIDYSTIPRAQLDEGQFGPHALEDGDLLVTRSGTCGVVSVFRKQATAVVPGAFLIRFRLSAAVEADFVRLVMMTSDTRRRVQNMAAGGVQRNLSGTSLSKLCIPIPPVEEQNEIVSHINALGDRIRAERAVVEHAKKLRRCSTAHQRDSLRDSAEVVSLRSMRDVMA